MKRFLTAALALTLLGTAAAPAMAQPFGHGGHYSRGGTGHGWNGGGYRHGGNGAVLGLGLGLFALAAIASQPRYDRYEAPAYYGPPPPPAYGNGYGQPYGNGYRQPYNNNGYDDGYGDY